MYLCHVSWRICVGVVVCLDSLLCSWCVGSISLTARVHRSMSSLVWRWVCLRYVVLRVPMLRLIFVIVFVRMVVFVFLVVWSSRSPPPPIKGPRVLRVCLRILGVGIGSGCVQRSPLVVGFLGFACVGWLCVGPLLLRRLLWWWLFGLGIVPCADFRIRPPGCSVDMRGRGGWALQFVWLHHPPRANVGMCLLLLLCVRRRCAPFMWVQL